MAYAISCGSEPARDGGLTTDQSPAGVHHSPVGAAVRRFDLLANAVCQANQMLGDK